MNGPRDSPNDATEGEERSENLVSDTDSTGRNSTVELRGNSSRDDTENGEQEAEVDAAALRARVRRLEEENDQLRKQYRTVRESRYARTALGLATVGVMFGLLGFVVIDAQEVLFVIAATGLFGAILTRFLTPERLVSLDVGEGIYAVLASNEASIADQLGLSSTRVYVTTERGTRLFVPEVDKYEREIFDTDEEFDGPLVVGETASRSGLSLRPTAEPLLRVYEEQHGGDLPPVPREAVLALSEGLTDALEIAASADTDLDVDEGRVTFEISEFLFGPPSRFDHPISSFLGTGLATALDTPTEVEVTTARRQEEQTLLVTCRWDSATADERDGEPTT